MLRCTDGLYTVVGLGPRDDVVTRSGVRVDDLCGSYECSGADKEVVGKTLFDDEPRSVLWEKHTGKTELVVSCYGILLHETHQMFLCTRTQAARN